MTRGKIKREPSTRKERFCWLEMALERTVHRLQGDDTEHVMLLSSTMHYGSLELLVQVFMQNRRKFLRSRQLVEDAVFMLGQIARRINSHLLPRIIALYVDLERLLWTPGGRCRNKEEARRIVSEFEHCYDFLMVETRLLDVRERAKIWPKAPEHVIDTSGDDFEVVYPTKGMTEEEATQQSRAAGFRSHSRAMKRIGFAEKVAALTACFTSLADDARNGVASDPGVNSPDWQALAEILPNDALVTYYEYYDVDLFLCHDPVRTNGYDDIGLDIASESTEESEAKMRMYGEIARYVDAAIALARSVRSESADGFILAKSLLEKYENAHWSVDSSISVKADLATFIDTLKSSIEHLHTDFAVAKLGGEAPIRVELTTKSGETIAKAVRPGRGGARRIFSEEVQEKCWHYWETGRKNPAVAQIAAADGRKLRHDDVFNYFRRELTALEPPIDTPEAFKSALRARTNRISRKKSH